MFYCLLLNSWRILNTHKDILFIHYNGQAGHNDRFFDLLYSNRLHYTYITAINAFNERLE